MSKPLSEMTKEEILEAIKEIRARRSVVADKPFITKGPSVKGKGKGTEVVGEMWDYLLNDDESSEGSN